MKVAKISAVLALVMWGFFDFFCEGARAQVGDLTELSIEALMNLEVTSVSKREEPLSQAAAAIYVITQEDIRRSGATVLPELLRMVPGLHVARIGTHNWAITSRGFNGLFANKLLVLIDGRSVYTPLFSGVYWDEQDIMLEDIERIEVIRGPGASLWGANAVNGVINIISKSARATQGGLVALGGGNQEQGYGAVRYGGKISDSALFRIYANGANRGATRDVSSGTGFDTWLSGRSGFRVDSEDDGDRITVQGDVYAGDEGLALDLPINSFPYVSNVRKHSDLDGFNLLGRWESEFSKTSNTSLQVYFDHSHRDEILLDQTHNIFDLDFQHHLQLNSNNEFVWGVGYRMVADDLRQVTTVAFPIDKQRTDSLFSGFLQDEMGFFDRKVKVTLGSKFEHNDFTGFEYQPNVRLSWAATDNQTVWAGVSRSVRTPSRAEDDIRISGAFVPLSKEALSEVAFFGQRSLSSEKLLSYEVGYRNEFSKVFSIDLAGFYNRYDRLVTTEIGDPFFDATGSMPHVVQPFYFKGGGNANTYGGEILGEVRPTNRFRLQAWYSYLRIDTSLDDGSTGFTLVEHEKGTPQNQFAVRTLWDVTSDWQFDSTFRFVDSAITGGAGAYSELALRLGWSITPDLDFSMYAENLLHDHHPEYRGTFIGLHNSELGRSYYGKFTWKF